MIYVILDTNIIFNNWFLKKVSLKRTLKLNQTDVVNVMLTEFNVSEIIKKYGDELKKKINEYDKIIKEMRRLIPKKSFLDIDFNIEFKHYNEIFSKQIEYYDVQIIPYPKDENSLHNISNRYFKSKKPFEENDKKSFPDAIIWESIREFIANEVCENDIVYFISNNHKDFADKENKEKLHADLFCGLPSGIIEKINYTTSLDEFLKFENIIMIEKTYIRTSELNLDLKKKDFEETFSLFLTRSDEIFDFFQSKLTEMEFWGNYITGWGEDPWIQQVIIISVESNFESDNIWIIEFQAEINVDFSITTISPVYEKGDDNEFIYEKTHQNFSVYGEIEFDYETRVFGELWNLDFV